MRIFIGFAAIEAVWGAAFWLRPDQAECGNPIVYAATNGHSYTATFDQAKGLVTVWKRRQL
jgi:hypothetical protein